MLNYPALTEQPTPSNIGNKPSLLLEGLTISKVTTAISRLIIIFLIFVYKAATSQLINLPNKLRVRGAQRYGGRGEIAISCQLENKNGYFVELDH